MKEIKTIPKDDRPIKCIFFEDDGSYTVGSNGVQEIVPYSESGEYSLITWFAVFRGGILELRINSRFVCGIEYLNEDPGER